jgi:pimeloyl-ACP methyl ester carboxylesterase
MPRSCALTAVTWILLRGLTREGAHWGSFARDLSDALEGARIVTLDLPGNGASYRRRSPITVQRLIEQSRVEIEENGLHPPFNLVAMSLGAMVAVEWVATYPAELRRCVLIGLWVRPP